MIDSEKIKDACHVVGGQLKCDACNRRICTRHYGGPYYPFCPWCGAPVTVEAQRLKGLIAMTATEEFRLRLERLHVGFETADTEQSLNTHFTKTLSGQEFRVGFYERLDGKPGTIGAKRELIVTSMGNITPDEAIRALTFMGAIGDD